jgi:hypothetical protein
MERVQVHGASQLRNQSRAASVAGKGAITIVGALQRQLLGTRQVRHRRGGSNKPQQSLPFARALSTPTPQLNPSGWHMVHMVLDSEANAARAQPAYRCTSEWFDAQP